MSSSEPIEPLKPSAVEETKEKQRRPGPRPVPCPWCDQTKCNHCRCLGHASCNHKPGEMCPNERYKRRLVCNPCEKNKLRKQKESSQQDSHSRNVVYNAPYDYRYYVNPMELPYPYSAQQYQTIPVAYQSYVVPEDRKGLPPSMPPPRAVQPPDVPGYAEPAAQGIKRSASKPTLAAPAAPASTDESVLICLTSSEDALGVITLNPETRFLSYVRKYLYFHFLEDLHKKEFSFVQPSGETIAVKKESCTLCSQILQTREKKHHTFNNQQVQKVLYIKPEAATIAKEDIDEAAKFFTMSAEKRVKLEAAEQPVYAPVSAPAAQPAAPVTVPQKQVAVTPAPGAASVPAPNPGLVRNPSYSYNPQLPSSYYPSVYYMPGTANRYVMNNYSSGNIPNVLSYGSIPGNLSGSYNSLTNYISRYNKANLSYTSMDYYDGAANANSYLPDNEINVLENAASTNPATAVKQESEAEPSKAQPKGAESSETKPAVPLASAPKTGEMSNGAMLEHDV